MANDSIISSDHPLDASQRQIFNAIVDTLIPASEDGAMPSASEFDVAAFISEKAPELAARLGEIVGYFDVDFPAQPPEARCERLTAFQSAHPDLFEPLLFTTYARYYQEDRVLVGIGSKAGPPFPQGNTVKPGDLSLLDPVVELNKHYRK